MPKPPTRTLDPKTLLEFLKGVHEYADEQVRSASALRDQTQKLIDLIQPPEEEDKHHG